MTLLDGETVPQWWHRFWCGFLIGMVMAGEWQPK